MASYMPLIVAIMNVGDSTARELQPSYHGLDYQSTPPAGENLPPSMKKFFGAMNSNDTTWWRSVSGEKGGGQGDGQGGGRLRHMLLVASLACGITGVELLVIFGFIYYVKHKKQTTSCLDSDKSIIVFTGK
ncbi:hypothetical protein MANES_05G115000v8 [Manihot esculenta]|uniref:Uncharacterized protein n=1 Tax=Manihot esculenta TaxID=3983 RepID=A0A2C9VVE8_MANES|nr:hypothetical protein MANES_05G115000v8 [Manihot esculenta]